MPRSRSKSYAQVFEEEGALDKLEAFASLNGPKHYRLPPNEETNHAGEIAVDRAGGGQRSRVPTKKAAWFIVAAKRSRGRLVS